MSALCQMSDTELDVLLHMDSPPLAVCSDSSQATIRNNAEIVEPCAEAVANCSLLNFDCGQSPSAMFSQFSESSHTQSANECLTERSSLKFNSPDIGDSIQQVRELPQVLTDQLHECQPSQSHRSHAEESIGKFMPFPIPNKIKQEVLEFSTVASAPEPCFNTTFENEFMRFENEDAAFLRLNFDFEPSFTSLERGLSDKSNDASAAPFNVLQHEERVCQSEVGIAAKPSQLALQNISVSCPMPRVASPPYTRSVDSSSGQSRDALHFLALDYSNAPSQRLHSSAMELPGSTVQNSFSVPLERPLDFSRCTNINETSSVAADPRVEFDLVNNSVADATMVPPSVKQLYDVIKAKYSDFAFVYALSAQLCQERVPMDCFVSLKMGLLLSLASIGPNPDRPPIPIVAIGSDTYMANYLMTSVGQLGTRFIGPTDDMKPPSSGSGLSNHCWIEADPILLAKGGVFYVGDWSRLKLARADKLFKIIECSRVPVEQTTRTYPLETTIWAHWRSFKYNAKDQQTFNKFVKIFGIPIYVDGENHEVLVNFTLEQSSAQLFESTVDHLSISSEDMRSFLSTVSKRTVDLMPEASTLLQKYFVAARIARPDCLTQQAFVVLKQFSESFAKLAFRHEVVLIDAVAAIYLCEHFMQNIFGSGDNPPPRFESHNFVGAVDNQMAQFHQWLQTYIATYYDKP